MFNLHLAASQPSASSCQEWSIEAPGYFADLFEPLPDARDGQVAVPQGPGRGVESNAGVLAAAEARSTTER